jgi:hypothetical protein
VSIPVTIEGIGDALVDYAWGYLTTVGDDQRSHSLAVPTVFRDGVFVIDPGKSARRNVASRPLVSLVFPHPAPGGFSLIIDGEAELQGDTLVVRPSNAILHRPAIAAH